MHDIAYLIKERERPKIKDKYVLQFDIKEQLRREYLKNMKMHIVFSEISCFTQMNINQLLQQRCLKEEKKPADANLKEQKLNQGMNYSLQTSYIKNVLEILQ